MKIKATILCENSVFHLPGALAEHGFSVFLETTWGNYLFDTGQGKAIINNGYILKKDLTGLKGIIISHNHYDHTGGLLPVLELCGEVKVYGHPSIFKENYANKNGSKRYIGIPFTRPLLESKGAQFILNSEWQEIEPGMYLSGEVPRNNDFEIGDTDFVIKRGNSFVPDEVLDDQSLIFKTDKGLFIVLGCAHAGIINILEYAINKTGVDKIWTVIGGTHLGPVSIEQREKTIKRLKEFDIDNMGVSHCTELGAAMDLRQELGEKFFFCSVGTVIEV